MQGDTVSVERVIPAPASAIFSLLADPGRHPDLDGSGTVVALRGGGPVTGVGDRFRMRMHMGLPYVMVSEVVEYERDRRIAWQPRLDLLGPLGRVVGGRIWRYELEPAEGGTLVRETWDVSRELLRPLVKLGGLPEATRRSMAATLERLEQLTAA